jgi:hypothetical protein
VAHGQHVPSLLQLYGAEMPGGGGAAEVGERAGLVQMGWAQAPLPHAMMMVRQRHCATHLLSLWDNCSSHINDLHSISTFAHGTCCLPVDMLVSAASSCCAQPCPARMQPVCNGMLVFVDAYLQPAQAGAMLMRPGMAGGGMVAMGQGMPGVGGRPGGASSSCGVRGQPVRRHTPSPRS